jgi:hypothetical protein
MPNEPQIRPTWARRLVDAAILMAVASSTIPHTAGAHWQFSGLQRLLSVSETYRCRIVNPGMSPSNVDVLAPARTDPTPPHAGLVS